MSTLINTMSDRDKPAAFEIPFPILKLLSWSFLKTLFQFEVRGLEHLDSIEGGIILAGNHTGLLDGPALLAACKRRFRFIMTEEVFTWGFIGKLVRYGNILPLYQGKARRLLSDAIHRLRHKEAICIFPEGKLTENGALNHFNEGVAFLHSQSAAPIVPFVIHGGFEAWPIGHRWPTFRKIVLEFGEPITPSRKRSRTEIVRLLKTRIERMKRRLHALEGGLTDPLPTTPTNLPIRNNSPVMPAKAGIHALQDIATEAD